MTDARPSGINNLPSNRNKDKEAKPAERPRAKPVVSEPGKEHKKSLGRRITESFTGDDVHSVGSYILFEVALPAVKQLISDGLSQGVERLLFGDGARSASRGSRPGYTSYNAVSRNTSYRPAGERPGGRPVSDRARATHDFKEVVLPDRKDAEAVIDGLNDLIEQYQSATVADFYDLVNISPEYTDNKWGWYELQGVSIRRVREGYLVELPRPQVLN